MFFSQKKESNSRRKWSHSLFTLFITEYRRRNCLFPKVCCSEKSRSVLRIFLKRKNIEPEAEKQLLESKIVINSNVKQNQSNLRKQCIVKRLFSIVLSVNRLSYHQNRKKNLLCLSQVREISGFHSAEQSSVSVDRTM